MEGFKSLIFSAGLALACLPIHASAVVANPSPVLWVGEADAINPALVRIDPLGKTVVATANQLGGSPEGMTFDRSGNLYVAINGGNDILRFDVNTGLSTVYAPNWVLGGTPFCIAFDNSGKLLVTRGNQLLRLDDPTHTSVLFSGSGYLDGVTCDATGNVFVVDQGASPSTGAIYKIDTQGHNSLFAGNLWTPIGLAFDHKGNLFLGNGPGQILEFDPLGHASMFTSDLVVPIGLQFDANDNLYVTSEHNVYMFDPTGQETLIASGFTKAGGLVIQPVPEPSALVLLGLGAVAAIGWQQRARG